MNPLIHPPSHPFDIPPFEEIESDHFLPAFERALSIQRKEYEAIESDPALPTFENTIVALERSGALLTLVSNVFYQRLGAHTEPALNRIAQEISPILAAHRDRLLLSDSIFKRVDSVHHQETSDLDEEERRMVIELHRRFTRAGVHLKGEARRRLEEINLSLSSLSVRFQQNLLDETNKTYILIDDMDDLDGLPQSVRDQAHALAQLEGLESGWMFKATPASMYPFLTFASHRDLRQELYQGYINRCRQGEYDNRQIAQEMATLRLHRARLLGYDTHADYVLEETMAGSPKSARALLDSVWTPALKLATQEAREMTELAEKSLEDFTLCGADWWYYAEQIKKHRYALSIEEITPYFPCDSVLEGAFSVAKKIFKIDFIERTDLPKYHEDMRSFEVRELDGAVIGVFYTDYYARPSKRGGAWMSALYEGFTFDEGRTPVVFNVCNFSPPTEHRPSLLSPVEIRTLFHELGHALHGLLSDSKYSMLGGTNVPRDFVEFPSQLMENWGLESEVMREYSAHFEHGGQIPQALLDQLNAAMTFNQGFATTEYCAAAYLDLAWHMIDTPVEDADAFEAQVMEELGMITEITSRYRSAYFAHIFAGGYSAGYYSYLWSAVLDKDTYQLFKETDLFDPKHSAALRTMIYATGNTKDPMTQYKLLCGRAPSAEALMIARGLTS